MTVVFLRKCYECGTLIKDPDPDNPQDFYLCNIHEDKDIA